MLRMSKLTDYGTIVLAHLAGASEGLHTAQDVAKRTSLAVPTVRKLLKSLVRAGLVRSERGASGGYALARPAEAITAAQVLDALEGPVAITECSSAGSRCGIEHTCALGGQWQRINLAIRRALEDISLAELAGPGPLTPPRMRLAGIPIQIVEDQDER